jgi:hypothetical protein
MYFLGIDTFLSKCLRYLLSYSKSLFCAPAAWLYIEHGEVTKSASHWSSQEGLCPG